MFEYIVKTETIAKVALCYVRNSGIRVENDEDHQHAHIQAICDQRGWKPEWYLDTEVHHSDLQEKSRPAWMKLKARLGDPDVVALVANDLSRIHRRASYILELIELLDKFDVRLMVANPLRPVDFSTPESRLLVKMSDMFDK